MNFYKLESEGPDYGDNLTSADSLCVPASSIPVQGRAVRGFHVIFMAPSKVGLAGGLFIL